MTIYDKTLLIGSMSWIYESELIGMDLTAFRSFSLKKPIQCEIRSDDF